ncbi:NAD(P)/FAD-dependent oxidoreductase [Candidatus Pelagadaptatus aseana]|uniref:NAD(P)/FAD-dependent oxidoreductase n=1 Tax=Candidatus Pelagadaptatus aseana TaxID=3120508 RepID=UPI003C6ED934
MTYFPDQVDVVVIGAGAAGLMCAITAGQRGRKVLVLDHANKVGKKILMSGGGRCNFTNMYTEPENYLSSNPHFCKSALAQYSQWDFIDMVCRHQIPYHEKKLGQLFCDNKASDIVAMLLDECDQAGAQVVTNCAIESVTATDAGYHVDASLGEVVCRSLVVATGGLSIPTMGATGLGYQLAEQFGLQLKPRTAGLVPFTLSKDQLQPMQSLVGSSAEVRISCGDQSFLENILFTHRGLSGPAVLQISSYWQPGQTVVIDWSPHLALEDHFLASQQQRPKTELRTLLAELHTKKWAQVFCDELTAALGIASNPLNQYSASDLKRAAEYFHQWSILPAGTEGYRTAEVTLGGVDTDGLSSKTMEAKQQQNLFFVGEVVDVTGWLGGFNFQWAWASGYVAGLNA